MSTLTSDIETTTSHKLSPLELFTENGAVQIGAVLLRLGLRFG